MVSLEVDNSRFAAPGNLDCRVGNLGQESSDRPQSLFKSYPNLVGNLQIDCGRRFAAASRKHLFTCNGRVCDRSYNRDVFRSSYGFLQIEPGAARSAAPIFAQHSFNGLGSFVYSLVRYQ